MAGLKDAPLEVLEEVVVADDDAARALPEEELTPFEPVVELVELVVEDELEEPKLLVFPSLEVIFPLSEVIPEVEFDALMLV